MDTWRLITTFGADPGFNMGLDEALLEDELAPPTLRLYTWEPDTLSLGYFQKFADVPAASGIDGRTPGALVRRITGGRGVQYVLECSGAPNALNEAARMVNPPLERPSRSTGPPQASASRQYDRICCRDHEPV